MKNEIIRTIEEGVNPALKGVSEILEVTDIDFQIEVTGTPEEIAEKQEVATSVRIPRFLGLSKVTSEIREGLKREAESSTDQELVYAVIGGESKTLERFSDILSRIEVFKKIISNDNSQEELLFQIRNWEETINEIIESILDPREKEKFHQIVSHKISELTSSPQDSKKDNYQERLKKLVQNPNAIKHLKKYLRPEQGESFSTTLIKEYFETANLINVLNVLRRLEKPIYKEINFVEKLFKEIKEIKQTNLSSRAKRSEIIRKLNKNFIKYPLNKIEEIKQNGSNPKEKKSIELIPEINFLETKREVEKLFKKIEEIKKSNLSPKEKIEKIRQLENYLKNIIIMCGNKIKILFPHDESIPDIETTTLKNVLKNERAICAGKVEILSAVLEFLGIDYEKVLVPGHTFMDIKLPSGDLMISDGNFNTREPGSKIFFYLLEAEPMNQNLIDSGIQNLPEEMQNRVIRRRGTNGKIIYYLSKTEPKLNIHKTGDLVDKNSPISTSILANVTFQDKELQAYKNLMLSEFYPSRVRLDEKKEVILEHTLKLLENGKINPEILVTYGISDLNDILLYIKEKNENVFNKTIGQISNFIKDTETKDRIFYDTTNLIYVEILINSFGNNQEHISSIEKLIQSKKFEKYKLKNLITSLLKNNTEIQYIYQLIEHAKKEDEKDYWREFNELRSIYFEFQNYQKLSPPADKSINDGIEIFEHRQIKEIEYVDGKAFISIVINLLNKNRLDELFKAEKISQEQRELLIKYLLERIKSNNNFYAKVFEQNEEQEKLIKLIEVLKSNTSLPDIINQLNYELLQRYDEKDSKLNPLIEEIKAKDKASFYSNLFCIERLWNEFPENREQLFNDLLENKDFLFIKYKNEDDLDTEIYNKRMKKLIQLIETDLGSTFKDRIISEINFQPKN